MRNPGLACLPLVLAVSTAWAQTPSLADQVAAAVSPLAAADRDGATVLGYREGTTLEVIRQGDNAYVCLADPPGDARFQVSCYHRDLEPFMARGRALRAEGNGMADVRAARAREIADGSLTIPDRASLVTLAGDVDPATGLPDSVAVLHVVYLPYATVETTGLPVSPAGPGQPFLMDAGLYRAHLMIPGPSRPYRP